MSRTRKTIAVIELEQVGDKYAATVELPSRSIYFGPTDTIGTSLDMARMELLAERDRLREKASRRNRDAVRLPDFDGIGERP